MPSIAFYTSDIYTVYNIIILCEITLTFLQCNIPFLSYLIYIHGDLCSVRKGNCMLAGDVYLYMDTASIPH